MSIKITIREEEILNTPNDSDLGAIIRKKYLDVIDSKENSHKEKPEKVIKTKKNKKYKDSDSWKMF